MIHLTPGYCTKGIIYDVDAEDGVVQRVYIRVPEIHGMPPEYIDNNDEGYTPDSDLPIARVALRSSQDDYSKGDIVSVTFPTGDLDEIYITGILCKAPKEGEDSGILGSLIDQIISSFKVFFGSDSSSKTETTSSGAQYSVNVSAEFKDYFQCPIIEGYNGISAYFGRYSNGNPHNGIDIRAAEGTPIYATGNGVVIRTQTGMVNNKGSSGNASYGNYVKIHHGKINGREIYSLYAHMSRLGSINGATVTSGMSIKKGDLIGYVGNTGNSYGNHLHFEIYDGGSLGIFRKNPQNYVQIPQGG